MKVGERLQTGYTNPHWIHLNAYRPLNMLLSRPLLLVILLFLASCGKQSLDTVDQTPLRPQDLQGKWLLFNYWASWCPSCLKEIPDLNRLQNEYGNTLTVLGVNTEHLSAAQQQQIASHYHIQYPLLLTDPASRWHLPHTVDVLPTTFVVSPKGKLTYTLRGSRTTAQWVTILHLKENNAGSPHNE